MFPLRAPSVDIIILSLVLAPVSSSLYVMAPSATDETHGKDIDSSDTDISALRKALISESVPLARRFRALFSLKHYASFQPPTEQSLPAIQAIAAAFPSPSALLKHELAYCLGQTRNLASVPFLREVLEDKREDSMCRHEAAEALGALGDKGSLDILRHMRDDEDEVTVVRETCDIAVGRIEWERSGKRKAERLRDRYVDSAGYFAPCWRRQANCPATVTSPR